MLGVGFHHPHTKWRVPRKLWDALLLRTKVEPAKTHEPPKGAPWFAAGDSNLGPGHLELVDGSSVSSGLFHSAIPHEGNPRMPDAAQIEMRRGYLACVHIADSQFGRVLDALKAERLWDDALVVFTSDHGYGLGEHGHWGKSSLYEIDTRVPMMIRDPRFPQSQGARSRCLVELVDLFKTFVDLGGLPYDPELYAAVDGQSLRPLLRTPSMNAHKWGKKIAITMLPKCPAANRAQVSIPFSCRFKSWEWTGDPSLVGYAARSEQWRYVAWMRHNSTELDNVDWSLPPYAEELYDHRADLTFDEMDLVNLIDTSQQTRLKIKAADTYLFRKRANELLKHLRERARRRQIYAHGKYPHRFFDKSGGIKHQAKLDWYIPRPLDVYPTQ